MRTYIDTVRFGRCVIELAQHNGEKWYEVFLPCGEEELDNEYIGDVDYNDSLDKVAESIDRDLY